MHFYRAYIFMYLATRRLQWWQLSWEKKWRAGSSQRISTFCYNTRIVTTAATNLCKLIPRDWCELILHCRTTTRSVTCKIIIVVLKSKRLFLVRPFHKKLATQQIHQKSRIPFPFSALCSCRLALNSTAFLQSIKNTWDSTKERETRNLNIISCLLLYICIFFDSRIMEVLSVSCGGVHQEKRQYSHCVCYFSVSFLFYFLQRKLNEQFYLFYNWLGNGYKTHWRHYYYWW